MSNRNMNPVRVNGSAAKTLRFRFAPNGSADPVTILDPHDYVASVTHAATGRWLVTMKDAYRHVLGVQVTFQVSTPTDVQPQVSAVTNENTANALTFLVRALAGGSETDIAANADNWVSIILDIEDTDASGLG